MFPCPERLNIDPLLFGSYLVLLKKFNGVSDELDIAHACAIVSAKTEILDSRETSRKSSINSL